MAVTAYQKCFTAYFDCLLNDIILAFDNQKSKKFNWLQCLKVDNFDLVKGAMSCDTQLFRALNTESNGVSVCLVFHTLS